LTVLLGIALGAAVFTSVRLSIHAAIDSFSQSMDLIAGKADWVVARPGGRVSENLIPTLLNHPAVETASPILTTYVKPSVGEFEPFLMLGFDPILDRPLRSWRIQKGKDREIDMWLALLRTPDTMVISEPLAARFGLIAGDEFLLEHARQKRIFRVSGVLSPVGLAQIEGGRVAITDISTFQEFTGLHGWVDRIDLLFKSTATESNLATLRRLLPKGIQLNPPTENKETGRRMILAYQLNLSILSFVSLFVGMFLVYSLVALNAASRRRELAILLSVGASPRNLFLLFLTEGALFGFLGWIFAIPLSTVLVKYLLHGVSQTISTLFVRVRVEGLALSGWELLLSFGITVAVSIIAAFQPARDAMKVSPKEAMVTAHGTVEFQKFSRFQAWIGLVFILLSYPLSKLPGWAGFPLPGYMAIFFIVCGFSLLAPLSLQRLGKGLASFLRRFAGEPAFLASRYVRDSGTRTAISVGALITAVALFGALVIMIHSFRQTVELWVLQSIQGDLFLRTKMADLNQYRDPLPDETVKAISHLTSPVDVSASLRYFLHDKKYPYQFEAMDFETFFRYGDFLYLAGKTSRVRALLIQGRGVLVSEVFANQMGLTVGDRYQAHIESVTLDLPILGIIRDYRTDGGVVFYELSQFQKHFEKPKWTGVRFFFRGPSPVSAKALAELKREIFEKCGDHIEVYSGKALRTDILKIFDETFAVTTVLLFIALVVAALGITTTLTVLVLERSRQLNTLYAIGAGFQQIRSMIFWEAALMITAGELGGLICGFFISYLLVFIINKESFGWTFHYGVDWSTLIMSLPLIFVTALLSAIPAAQMVFREPPATLLKE
jgi:putative ABC transport system permease protein